MTPSEGAELVLDSGQWIHVEQGVGGTVPLLLVHGFMGSAESWRGAVSYLPEAVAWAAVDLPGHGSSGPSVEPEGYAVPAVARLLGEVQARLFQGPSTWLGYSMGGRISLSAAVQGLPMAGLLLESTSPGLASAEERRERRRLDEARAGEVVNEGIEAFVDRWLSSPLFRGVAALSEEDQEGVRRIRASQDPDAMAAWLREGGTGAQPSYWDALGGLEMPVHLLTGADDEKFDRIATAVAARVPGATTRRLPGCGHLPHLEQPREWARWVGEVLGL